MLNPGSLSSTPISRARKARSCPSNSFTGSASAVVANGIVAGSHLHRSFSGGNPASKVMVLVAIVESSPSSTGFSLSGFRLHVYSPGDRQKPVLRDLRRATLAQARRRVHRRYSYNFQHLQMDEILFPK